MEKLLEIFGGILVFLFGVIACSGVGVLAIILFNGLVLFCGICDRFTNRVLKIIAKRFKEKELC